VFVNIEIGYVLAYDFYKSSYGQGSWQSGVRHRGFLVWNGSESFEDLILRNHPEFVAEAEASDGFSGSDRNHRIEISCLRIGGEKSQVILTVEKQTVYLKKDIAAKV
jgi:hypothetical protein